MLYASIENILYSDEAGSLWAKLVPAFADRECHVVSAMDSPGR
jgi:hypothetical protein